MRNIRMVKGLLVWGFLGVGVFEVEVNAGCAFRLVKRASDSAVTETIVQLWVQRESPSRCSPLPVQTLQ